MRDMAMRPVVRHGADDTRLLIAPLRDADPRLGPQSRVAPIARGDERAAQRHGTIEPHRSAMHTALERDDGVGRIDVERRQFARTCEQRLAQMAVLDDVPERRVADLAMVVM